MTSKMHYLIKVITNKYHITMFYGLCGYNDGSWLKKHSNNWEKVTCKKCLTKRRRDGIKKETQSDK